MQLCKQCFYAALEDEVHETIIKNKLFKAGERIAVAASGDVTGLSTTALQCICDIVSLIVPTSCHQSCRLAHMTAPMLPEVQPHRQGQRSHPTRLMMLISYILAWWRAYMSEGQWSQATWRQPCVSKGQRPQAT